MDTIGSEDKDGIDMSWGSDLGDLASSRQLLMQAIDTSIVDTYE